MNKKQQIINLSNQLTELTTLNNALNNKVEELNHNLFVIKHQYDSLQTNYVRLQEVKEQLSSQKLYNNCDEIKQQELYLSQLKSEIDIIKSANYINTLGFYDLKNNSKYYQDELSKNRSEQKLALIKKTYYAIIEQCYINGNQRDGSKLMEFLTRISISSLNIMSDSILDSVSIINVDNIKDRITRIFDNYNKELTKYGVELSSNYLQLKLDEVDIRLKIYIAKQNEKEEENRRKEILKEQLKIEKEIQINKDKLNKQLVHYQIQLNKGADVQDKIDEIEAKIETEDYMLTKTKVGFVYIISNPSLGNDVYKIGITRRVSSIKGDESPCSVRINELSGSNVPFKFKPNCIIWSEDCFKLESALHREFDKYRVNIVKCHREFFKLPLSEIEKVVKNKYDKDAIFDYDIIDEDFVVSGYKVVDNFVQL